MKRLAIRSLPVEPMSYIGAEEVRRIKSIPDCEITYSASEIELMERAHENLVYMMTFSDGRELEVVSQLAESLSKELEAHLSHK